MDHGVRLKIRAANVSLPSPLLGRGAGGEGQATFGLSLQLSRIDARPEASAYG